MSAEAAGAAPSAPLTSGAGAPAGAGDPPRTVDRHARGHQSEGISLAAERRESTGEAAGCPSVAEVRRYEIAAIDVDITLNRFGDHDPEGRMYALEKDLPRIRREQAHSAQAKVSFGLQTDLIQPLTLRVNQGECLRIKLTNRLKGKQDASLHLHESALRVRNGGPAIASNPKSRVGPNASVTYEWMVGSKEPEGTHYFHSHTKFREQTSHGLFGAVIVEPKGSIYLNPLGGGGASTGWMAMISGPGVDFREFVLFYHEIGHENFRLRNQGGELVPLVDPLTNAYRPAARAINYRSESFLNRLELQKSLLGRFDESVSYSSYSFGDPATPIARSYIGEPTKQRVVHAGSEVGHVHHVHGGSIRWRRQPGAEASGFSRGLQKHPPLLPNASERIDSQTIGPSETFEAENECGAGGCQQSVGDFLIHCHIAHHYFAGMWGLWRVYGTLQNGDASTDGLPALRELPDREKKMVPAVTSDALIGKTVVFGGRRVAVDSASLAELVESQLPPRGVPDGYDASVLDWSKEADRYLNEPDAERSWPGFDSPTPGKRRPLLFEQKTGRLAYPFLRPHLGKRPPFPPDHSPAPYLDPGSGPDPPEPGVSGPASVCPAGTNARQFQVQAITTPIVLNQKAGLVDPAGEIFILKDDEAAVRADPRRRVPLAIRANAGEDCIDVVLRSELEDSEENRGFAKVNLHIHLLQFDVQASDGVIAGFNYEQSVRPFALAGAKLTSASAAGTARLELDSGASFQPGALIGIGMDQGATFEVGRAKLMQGGRLTLHRPLTHSHGAGEWVSTEFVRSRWYPDVQFGTAYFHDHVNAISSWRHGLFGALVAEPPGASYHDPHTGAHLASGPIADVHTEKKVSADVRGSFREMVLFVQDDNPLTHIGRSTGGSLNLRVEPFANRPGDPAARFSSAIHGDPETPVLSAYLGDPVVLRSLVPASNEISTLHLDGHWFRAEPFSTTSPPISTVHLGISERYDLFVPRAGGPQRRPGDYVFRAGRPSKTAEGAWGILRVLDQVDETVLRRLPGRQVSRAAPRVCPSSAPKKSFEISAVDSPLPMSPGGGGRAFVVDAVLRAGKGPERPPAPLVIHVNSGDCLALRLTNRTVKPVGINADMLAFDPRATGFSAGAAAVAMPGGQRNYELYAHPELGEGVALLTDGADVAGPKSGLYGAVVVGPAAAVYRDPSTGADLAGLSSWKTTVRARGRSYRDFTLFLQDEDLSIGTHRMPYTQNVRGAAAINYAIKQASVLEALAGDPTRIHVLAPWSEQTQVFSIEGHRWKFEPLREGSDLLSSVTIGGLEAMTLQLEGGAGGPGKLPGDYQLGNHRGPYTEAGMVGTLRVYPPGSDELRALPPSCAPGEVNCAGGGSGRLGALAAAAAVACIGGLSMLRRRKDKREKHPGI